MEFNHEGELPGPLSFRVFGSPAALAQAVAGRVHEAVLTGVRARGRASLLLDAGPVLRRGYELLAAAPLPWGSVRIALSPAGPAAIGHLDPRENFLRDTLLRGAPAAAQLALQGLTDDEMRQSGEPDLLLLAMSANGSISALATDPPSATTPATIAAISALESRRIVIVGQGLTARDAFERQALAKDAPASALQALAQEAVQPIEFCWCR